MRKYVEFARKTFQQNSVYKLQYYTGLFNTVLSLFIGAAIWKAVYGDAQAISGVTKEQMITYAVVGMIMRSLLSMNEFIIGGKIHSGEIAVDLLKPMKFPLYIFSVVTGEVLYNLLARVLPVVIPAFFLFGLVLPDERMYILFFAVSLFLSYLVLFSLNMIFWLMAFWIHHTWSTIHIKNAIIAVLSGSTIPLWFMPDKFARILSWLPFKDIYFTPLTIFLGKAAYGDIARLYAMQCIWFVLLTALNLLIWKKAQTRLIIQGG